MGSPIVEIYYVKYSECLMNKWSMEKAWQIIARGKRAHEKGGHYERVCLKRGLSKRKEKWRQKMKETRGVCIGTVGLVLTSLAKFIYNVYFQGEKKKITTPHFIHPVFIFNQTIYFWSCSIDVIPTIVTWITYRKSVEWNKQKLLTKESWRLEIVTNIWVG